jgi:hypothetical protein
MSMDLNDGSSVAGGARVVAHWTAVAPMTSSPVSGEPEYAENIMKKLVVHVVIAAEAMVRERKKKIIQ